jgi:hypothetical protein
MPLKKRLSDLAFCGFSISESRMSEDEQRLRAYVRVDTRLKEIVGNQRVAELQQEEQARLDRQRQLEEEQNLKRDRDRIVQLGAE